MALQDCVNLNLLMLQDTKAEDELQVFSYQNDCCNCNSETCRERLDTQLYTVTFLTECTFCVSDAI